MPTHKQMKELRFSKKAPTGTTADFKKEIYEAFTKAGIAMTPDLAMDAGPHSVVVLMKDEDESATVWAVPDANIDAADRGRLDRLNGACFETMFTGDLKPEQFAGALLVLVRTGNLRLAGKHDGLYKEIEGAFAADGAEMPDADWPTIAGDVWGGRDATAGLGPIEPTHLYCFHLAM